MKKKIAIIGPGFSGLSAAAYAASAGHEVHVFEKNVRSAFPDIGQDRRNSCNNLKSFRFEKTF